MKGYLQTIFIAPVASQPMVPLEQVLAVEGLGLEGDRYHAAAGSYNKDKPGNRQVTLISGDFFKGSGFVPQETRRNLVTSGVELMWLIGRQFTIGFGGAVFYGERYCDPCKRPSTLSGNPINFNEAFFDRGGLVARVVSSGIIRVGDSIPRPPR